MGTQRTKAELDALLADNNERLITPAKLRDMLESLACTNGSLYVTTPAATTIATPSTFVKVAGTTTMVSGAHRVDMPQDNRLRYLGIATVHIHLVANLSVSCAANNQHISFAIFKNGVKVDHSQMDHLIGTGTDVKIMAIHADMDLTTNDYVELWVSNETSTGAVTVEHGYMFFMGMLCE